MGEWPDGLYEAEMRVAAFQNGYYIALCNRVGEEDCLTFAGESFVCAPDGAVIARAQPAQTRSSTPTSTSRRLPIKRPTPVPARPPAGIVRRVDQMNSRPAISSNDQSNDSSSEYEPGC